jgi:AbrB family looped-hinge helix DNA binding protein
MTTATLSSRGQVVIPAPLRKLLDWTSGDKLSFEVDSARNTITIQKRDHAAEIEERAQRLTAMIPSDVAPLEDAHALYATRKPRL